MLSVVFAMTLVVHALVALTGTLIVAMEVPASYDLIAVVDSARVWPSTASTPPAPPA